MNFSSTFFSAALIFSCLAVPGYSATVNVSTGLDGSNLVITSGGASDAHWNADQQGGGSAAAQVSTASSVNWYNGWIANDSDSAWIGRDASNASNGADASVFSTAFDLTGLDLSTVSLSGEWGIDDQGTLTLNGNQISVLGSGYWGGLTPFSVAAGSAFFNSGVNVLAMTITQSDDYLEAVRLHGSVTGTQSDIRQDVAATPEPSSIALLFAGAGALAIRRIRARA